MQKTERLAIKVLVADKQALSRLADADGEAMAVVMRRLIREEASRHGLCPAQQIHPRSQAQP
jgi:hypothetical protein